MESLLASGMVAFLLSSFLLSLALFRTTISKSRPAQLTHACTAAHTVCVWARYAASGFISLVLTEAFVFLIVSVSLLIIMSVHRHTHVCSHIHTHTHCSVTCSNILFIRRIFFPLILYIVYMHVSVSLFLRASLYLFMIVCLCAACA